jgi:hypothetical protein
MNEAIVWSVVRREDPALTTAECSDSVQRLITAGRLFRDRRRTRTYLKPVLPRQAKPVTRGQDALWDENTRQQNEGNHG